MIKNEWERLGDIEANSIHYWYRNKFNLPLTDPRYLNATEMQIRLEFEADLAFQILTRKLADPDFDEEVERENAQFSMRAKNEPGYIDKWCRQMEKELSKNPQFNDGQGNFTTEKIEMIDPESIPTKPVSLEDIEKAEKELENN